MTFKRSTCSISVTIIFVIVLFYAISLAIQLEVAKVHSSEDILTQEDIKVLILYVKFLFFSVVCVIAIFMLPPDFEYSIVLVNDWIVFRFSSEDNRILGRNFNITSKSKNYILLDDGISIIKIEYSQDVLNFLNEISISNNYWFWKRVSFNSTPSFLEYKKFLYKIYYFLIPFFFLNWNKAIFLFYNILSFENIIWIIFLPFFTFIVFSIIL